MRVVTGEAKGRKLKSPTTIGTRPITARVKTALFDILTSADVVTDANFLDLFAGTGGVGIEALSRGAAHATFIEMNQKIISLVRENLQITALTERSETIRSDSFKFLQSYQLQTDAQDVQAASHTLQPPAVLKREYNIIYIAPPQYEEMAAKALGLVDNSLLLADPCLVIVQIHPKERPGVAAVTCQRLEQTDERRYGSTLLMFYKPKKIEKSSMSQV